MSIELQTAQALFLEFYLNDLNIATGTGFVAQAQDKYVLITNRHNVTGRHQDTGKPLHSQCAVPNQVKIWHHWKSQLGAWVCITQPLFKDEDFSEHLWIEHPVLGEHADFVALPLENHPDIKLFPITINSHDFKIGPSEKVSVIGFPFGKSVGGKWPIWANGTIASEPDFDYEAKPVILIDCRSRTGQSGSPVIAFRSGGGVEMRDGSTNFFNGPVSKFIGIYSGRISPESDLGMVWKASAIQELINSI